MPMMETPDELADRLADLAGIYGAHDEERCTGGEDLRYSCRVCFVSVVADDIRTAVENEKTIEAGTAAKAKRGGA